MPKPPDQRPFHALPKRKKDFVKHYVKTGNAYEAYTKAGYKATRSAHSNARKMQMELANHIKNQIAEYISGTDMAIMGLRVVADLAENSNNDMVRLQAAKEMLSRSLPETPKEVHHHHTSDRHQLSDEQLLQRLKKLQDKLFIDAPAIEVVENEEAGTGRVPTLVGGTGTTEEVQ